MGALLVVILTYLLTSVAALAGLRWARSQTAASSSRVRVVSAQADIAPASELTPHGVVRFRIIFSAQVTEAEWNAICDRLREDTKAKTVQSAKK